MQDQGFTKRSIHTPIFCTDIALSASSATINDDSEDDKPYATENLYYAEDKFNYHALALIVQVVGYNRLTFPIPTYTKYLDYAEEHQEHRNPYANINVIPPKLNGNTGSNKFERQNGWIRELALNGLTNFGTAKDR